MNEPENELLYKNLVFLLQLFNERPYHLAKYLLDNNAFSAKFKKKILDSKKINEHIAEDTDDMLKALYLKDITKMVEYLKSFTEVIVPGKEKTKQNLSEDLNLKLDQYLAEDKFEDAIRIRDYMKKHNIKRIS